MAAALATSPPSSQIMDSSLSPPGPPPSDSPPLDQSNRFGRSLSLSRNGDLQSSGSLRSEEYRQLFRLPPEEVLLQDFNCALQENILIQGHMYLFDHYICFYSNIFGFETKKIIPFQDVTSVKRAKTAGIFPNAIEIVASGKKHFFASFLSRDEAFKLITDGWSQHGDDVKEDSKSETSSQSNGVNSVENGINFESQTCDLESDHDSLLHSRRLKIICVLITSTWCRNLEVSRSEDTKIPQNYEDGNAKNTASDVPDVAEENRDSSADAEPSTSSGPLRWKQETRNAPEIPNCFTKVAESKFPISVERFFDLFFSDDAVGFVESFHKKCGDKDIRCTSWSPHDTFGYVREKTFQHPIKVYFGAKCGGCKETQKFRVYKDRHLVIETSQEVSDVPYADYFTVEGIWDVQTDRDQSDEHCVLRVYLSVAFSKKTIWKGKIEQSTMEECREVFATWIDLAHELLKQKKLEKTEERATVTVLQDGQVDQVSSGQSERLHGNAGPGRIGAAHEQIGNPLDVKFLDATTIASTLRAVALKLCSFMKRYGSLQMFLVIGFSIILLLMQLSIVVLLSRPQQVHVIPQSGHVPSVGLGASHRVSEDMHWIEKRMHLLKDEMLVVEAQIERMRNEHSLLKAQLMDLEHLKQHQS